MYEIRPLRRRDDGYMFGCALASMFGFSVVFAAFFVSMALVVMWAKASPARPTYVTIVITATPPALPTAASVAIIPPTSTIVPTNTPLPTVAPTDTPAPSPTPLPTDAPTLVPPTETPLPTETPVPLPTQTSIADDPVVRSYAEAVGHSMDLLVSGSHILGSRLSEIDANPDIMNTDAWKISAAGGVVSLRAYSESIRGLTPPAYFLDPHNDLVQSANHVDIAMTLLTSAIDNRSMVDMTNGTKEILTATEFMNSAKAKFLLLNP